MVLDRLDAQALLGRLRYMFPTTPLASVSGLCFVWFTDFLQISRERRQAPQLIRTVHSHARSFVLGSLCIISSHHTECFESFAMSAHGRLYRNMYIGKYSWNITFIVDRHDQKFTIPLGLGLESLKG